MKRIIVSLCVCLFVLSLASAEENPGHSRAHGKTLSEWMKLYWTWSFGGDQEGEVKNAVFLPLPTWGEPNEDGFFIGELDLTLRPGKAFVLPMYVASGELYLDGTVDDPESIPASTFFQGEEGELAVQNLQLTLDGKVILDGERDDLRDYFFDTQYFDDTLFYEEPTGYGSIGVVWVKGIGFVHPPLSKGSHTLVLSVDANYPFYGRFAFENTWNITVAQ